MNTFYSHCAYKRDVLQFLINKPIVEIIIGGMFFHPDEIQGVTQMRSLRNFKMADDDDADGENGLELYHA